MITDINNSVIMTSTVAEYANKARRREIKGIEPARWRGKREKRRRCRPVHRRSTGYEIRENKEANWLRRRSAYRDDRKNSHAVRSSNEERKGYHRQWRGGSVLKKMHFQAHSLSAIRRRCEP